MKPDGANPGVAVLTGVTVWDEDAGGFFFRLIRDVKLWAGGHVTIHKCMIVDGSM